MTDELARPFVEEAAAYTCMPPPLLNYVPQ